MAVVPVVAPVVEDEVVETACSACTDRRSDKGGHSRTCSVPPSRVLAVGVGDAELLAVREFPAVCLAKGRWRLQRRRRWVLADYRVHA